MDEKEGKKFLEYNDLDFQEIRNYKLTKNNYKSMDLYLKVRLIERQIEILEYFVSENI